MYLARHLQLERDVAIKLLSVGALVKGQEERSRERFRREAVALSRLRHPNTVQVVDFGWTDDHRPYIVTELLTGHTLDVILEREGAMDPDRALNILLQMCMSLAEAHQYGIVHRDLKPSNVFLIEAFGTHDFAKVIDFGVARIDATDESAKNRPLTVEGTTLGTPDYMAPEQARAQTPSPATDVYALGCILYEMLTGAPPFSADTALQVMIKQIKEMPKPISQVRPGVVSRALESALMLALRKAPEERPANAGAFLDVLNACKKPARPMSAPSTEDDLAFGRTAEDLRRPVEHGAVRSDTIPDARRARPEPVEDDAPIEAAWDPTPNPDHEMATRVDGIPAMAENGRSEAQTRIGVMPSVVLQSGHTARIAAKSVRMGRPEASNATIIVPSVIDDDSLAPVARSWFWPVLAVVTTATAIGAWIVWRMLA